MKRYFFALVAALLILAGAIPAMADDIEFAPLVGQTVALTVEPYSSGENNGAYYVGLTQGVIGGQTFWMFCVDFLDEISVPTTYDVTVVSLASPLPSGLYTMGLDLNQLQQQATLGRNFGTAPSGNLLNDVDAQQDIWNETGAGYALDEGMAEMNSTMLATYGSGNYYGSILLSAVAGGQNFMPVAEATPEPATFGLLGGALVCLGFLESRKRRTSSQ